MAEPQITRTTPEWSSSLPRRCTGCERFEKTWKLGLPQVDAVPKRTDEPCGKYGAIDDGDITDTESKHIPNAAVLRSGLRPR